MKNRKNLMVLVLLALFMGVSCADENNATDNDDPWGLEEVKKSFEEADKVIARKEKAKEKNAKAKAENEAVRLKAAAH